MTCFTCFSKRTNSKVDSINGLEYDKSIKSQLPFVAKRSRYRSVNMDLVGSKSAIYQNSNSFDLDQNLDIDGFNLNSSQTLSGPGQEAE